MSESRGVDFILLDVTEEELVAIRVVRLLFSLLHLVLDEQEEKDMSTFTLFRDLAHDHFSVFSAALGLHGDIYECAEGICPALDLYERAYDKKNEGAVIGWTFFLGFHPDLEEDLRRSIAIAKRIPEVDPSEAVLRSAIQAFMKAISSEPAASS